MFTVTLPLPPTSKNHSKTRSRYTGALVKTADIVRWEQDCALLMGGYQPPHEPLIVHITLGYPRNRMHMWDIDGRLSMLLDVLGCHRDQWIDELHVVKVPGDNDATITVSKITE